MKTYRMFANQDGSVQAIKVGWSCSAFCLTMIWSLSKKLWIVSAILIGFILISALIHGDVVHNSGFVEIYSSEYGASARIVLGLIGAAVSVVFGIYGNSWRERRLVSLGYDCQDIVSAKNPEVAIATWMKDNYEIRRPVSHSPHIAQVTI